MTDLPPLPNPESLCERPGCDHTQADHSRVLGMKCLASDCDCPRFVGPGIDELMAQLEAYAKGRGE